MSSAQVFFYVQHLLGIGHLKRAMTLASAMCASGLRVTVASGGQAVPELMAGGIHVVQLPAVAAADLTFKNLVDAAGHPITESWKQTRCAALLAAFRATQPQALVIELFPFGRKQMRFELLPLLELAKRSVPRPLIICSLRDIGGGGQRDPRRQQETLDLVERYFDYVLVHGDPALIPIAQSFGFAERIRERIYHTGYVVEAAPQVSGAAGRDEVLVSAGGGAVGRDLLQTALRARSLSCLAQRTWRLITGINAAAADAAMISALAIRIGEGRVVVERMRSDFATLLGNCAVSVSQAGYNTVMEIVALRARAVVVPFAGGIETEQMLRAKALASHGYVELLAEAQLTPQNLAAAIDRVASADRPPMAALNLNGAETSARVINTMLAARSQ